MDFLSNRTQTEIILFCVYIVVMLSAFLFIWIPYMRRINLKIWRTKGMLNMIPMEVINKHESLKNAFISGDILSAVKWEKEQIVLEEQHERTQDYSKQILLSNGLNFIWLYFIPTLRAIPDFFHWSFSYLLRVMYSKCTKISWRNA